MHESYQWEVLFDTLRRIVSRVKDSPQATVADKDLAYAVELLAGRVEIVEKLRAGYGIREGASIADLQPGDLYRQETPT